MHYRTCFDSPYVGAWDLRRDRDSICVIERVERGELTGQKGKKDKKAIVYFKGKKKPFAANITNARTIARMWGNDTRGWIGKPIALYVAMVEAFGEQVEAIRVRPTAPELPQETKAPAGPAPDENDAAEPEENDDERQSA